MALFKKIYGALNRAERTIFIAAFAVLILSGAAWGILALGTYTRVVPAEGGEFTEGIVGQPSYINPVMAASETDKAMVRLLFANLTDLAEKIEADKGDRTWRVRLKEGLTWSNGEKLTSDDIIFTVQKLQDPESLSPYTQSWYGVTASRVSELELTFNLASPYPFFAEHLENLYPIPKHLFAETPLSNWRLSEYNLKPVGSGPYKFDTYEKKANGFIAGYKLVKNPGFAGKQPLIPVFLIQFFAQKDDVVKAFNTGKIDGFADINERTDKIQRPYQVFSFYLPSYYAVFINQNQHPALKEVVVRKALSAAINREELVSEIFNGRALPVLNPVPKPFQIAATSTPADLNVNELLEHAGWTLQADGHREKTIGKDKVILELDFTVPNLPFLTDTAARLASAWGKIGVKVNVNSLSVAEISDRAIKNREYQLLLFGNVLNPAEDLYSFWHSNERFHPGLNLSLYSNRQADQLIESIRRNFDPVSREAQLQNLGNVIAADYPAVFLFSPDYLFAANKDLHGVEEGFIREPADRFRSVSSWYVKTARTFKD